MKVEWGSKANVVRSKPELGFQSTSAAGLNRPGYRVLDDGYNPVRGPRREGLAQVCKMAQLIDPVVT